MGIRYTPGEHVLMIIDQAGEEGVHPWDLTGLLKKLRDAGFVDLAPRVPGRTYDPLVVLTPQGEEYLRRKGLKTNGKG
jgi:DNA-binding MarR family transcriptional regulator